MQKINKLQARKAVAQGRSVFLRPDNRKGYHVNGLFYPGQPVDHSKPFDAQVAEFENQLPIGARRAAYVAQD